MNEFIQSGKGPAVLTVQTKRKEFVNVKDFGAVGDGKADDTQAFIYALAASDGKEPVLVPAGQYLITKPLDLGHAVLWAKRPSGD